MATFTPVLLVASFLVCCAIAQAQQQWNPNQGNFNDLCDDTRLCNTAKNFICNRAGSYGTGRCKCKVTPYTNVEWVYNPALDACQDPNAGNLNPHHHYDPNRPQPQPNPYPQPNPFPGAGGNHGGNNGGGFGGGSGPAGVGTSCIGDSFCRVTLGDLSRCNFQRCECFDTRSNGKAVVREYNGKCWMVLYEHQACTNDSECILGGSNLRCKQDSNNSYLKHCKCEGRGCRNSASSVTMLTSVTLGLIALVATKIVL